MPLLYEELRSELRRVIKEDEMPSLFSAPPASVERAKDSLRARASRQGKGFELSEGFHVISSRLP